MICVPFVWATLLRSWTTTPSRWRLVHNKSGAGEADPFPVSERVRSLVESRKAGTFTTVELFPRQDKKGSSGMPLYGSTMPYVLDQEAFPIVALRPDENHTKNLESVELCSLVVYPLTPLNINPSNLSLPRVNMAGRLQRLDPSEPGDGVALVRDQYLSGHPGSKKIIDDLVFHRMKIRDMVYCSSGLRETVHVSLDEYKSAKPDEVTRNSRPILEWMNERKQAIYLKLFCREYAQVEDVGEIFMFLVDRKGFEVMAWRTTNRKWFSHRFHFPSEMKDVGECKRGLLEACAYLHDKYLKNTERWGANELNQDKGS